MSYDGRARSKQMCAGYATGGLPTGGRNKIGPGKSPARGPRMPKPLAAPEAVVPPMAAATPAMQPIARGGRVNRSTGGGVVDRGVNTKPGGNMTIQTGGARKRFAGGGGVMGPGVDEGDTNAVVEGQTEFEKQGPNAGKKTINPRTRDFKSGGVRGDMRARGGAVVMPESGNEGAKYDLGRASGGRVGVGPDVAGASRRKLAQDRGASAYAAGGMPKRKGC